MLKRAVAFLLSLSVAVCLLSGLPAAKAAQSIGAAFASELKNKYGIQLTDAAGALSGDDAADRVSDLKRALEAYSPALIKAMSSYYAKQKINAVLRLETGNGKDGSDGDITLNTKDKILAIRLFVSDDGSIDGVDCETLAHELGHLVTYMLEDIYGSDKLRSEWKSFNGGIVYAGGYYQSLWKPEYEHVFSYDYGLTDFYEDIATLYESLVSTPTAMTYRLSDSASAPLRQKVAYLKKMTEKYIGKASQALYAPLDKAVSSMGSIVCSPWAFDEINSAVNQGFFTADPKVDLRKNITRLLFIESAMLFLSDHLDTSYDDMIENLGRDPSKRVFRDTADDNYAVKAAYYLGLIRGRGASGLFQPNSPITREESAVVLQKLMTLLGFRRSALKANLADRPAVSVWALGSVDYIVSYGVMVGDTKRLFRPRNSFTMEQAFVTFYRIFKNLS